MPDLDTIFTTVFGSQPRPQAFDIQPLIQREDRQIELLREIRDMLRRLHQELEDLNTKAM